MALPRSKACIVERLQLYELRWSDRRIAEHQGVSPYIVRQWRIRNELPVHPSPRRAADHERRIALLKANHTDQVCAELLGMSEASFSRWRAKNKLPRNVRQEEQGGQQALAARMRDTLAQDGATFEGVAARYNMTPEAARKLLGKGA